MICLFLVLSTVLQTRTSCSLSVSKAAFTLTETWKRHPVHPNRKLQWGHFRVFGRQSVDTSEDSKKKLVGTNVEYGRTAAGKAHAVCFHKENTRISFLYQKGSAWRYSVFLIYDEKKPFFITSYKGPEEKTMQEGFWTNCSILIKRRYFVLFFSY